MIPRAGAGGVAPPLLFVAAACVGGSTGSSDTDSGHPSGPTLGCPECAGEPSDRWSTPDGLTEDDMRGYVNINWLERDHLGITSRFSMAAAFRNAGTSFTAKAVEVEAAGLDTCWIYRVHDDGKGWVDPGHVGELTITFDDEVWFQDGPVGDEHSDAMFYQHQSDGEAWNEWVGLRAEGFEAIPRFDLPQAGRFPSGPIGLESPIDETPELDDLEFRWSNPTGGAIWLIVSVNFVNAWCQLNDDGAWKLPAEYVPHLSGPRTAVSASLSRGTYRWIRLGDGFIVVGAGTQVSWSFGVTERK